MRTLLAVVLASGALLMGIGHYGPAPASELKQAALIVDANTGRVLHEQFADAPRHPASLTKMMTLYMAFGEIAEGRLTYGSKITVSERAASVAPSKLELEPGDEIELIDAIKALITKSANDMAVAIAERIGGSEANFVQLMNARARQIGMTSTTFRNASGLPDARQITTARDMVTLALRLEDEFPEHYKLFSLREFAFRGKVYKTHNTLMLGFPGMDGIKTGYTRASGFNLVSSVKADQKHLVGAVFGGTTAATRNAHMRSLLFRALETASTKRSRTSAPPLVAAATPPRPRPAKPVVVPKPTPAVAARPTEAGPRPVATGPRLKPGAGTGSQGAKQAAAPSPDKASIPQPRPQAQVAQARPGTQFAPAAAAPRLDLSGLRNAISTGSQEPPDNGPAEPTGIAALISASGADASPAAQAEAPKASFGDVAPSHLMEPGAAPTPSPPPQKAAAAASVRKYEIQIGAYASAEEAQAKLTSAQARAQRVLDGHEGVPIAAQKGNKQIFRARFLAFDEAGATHACHELRRLAIDCFVMKVD